MIQLDILSGKQAGGQSVPRHLPFRVGRAEDSSLILTDDGLWDSHFEVQSKPGAGFVLVPCSEAICLVNGERVTNEVPLRNGDIIGAGSVEFRFTLAPIKQRSMAVREAMIWIALGLLFVVQIGLIYLVLP